MLKISAEMYSVDITEECYRKPGYRTGYQLENIRNDLTNYDRHHFYLGKELPYVIDDIGADIDFAILDTAHYLPGEILDFLCVLPYMSEGATVVLHDVTLNLYDGQQGFATKILLDVVRGVKYWNYGNDLVETNIAAFSIDEETKRTIINVFSSLTCTWAYMPEVSSLGAYNDIYKKYYETECVNLWQLIVNSQMKLLNMNKRPWDETRQLLQAFEKYGEVYSYGTGERGKALSAFLATRSRYVEGYCISDNYSSDEANIVNDKIKTISAIDKANACVILATSVNECFWNLASWGGNMMVLSDNMWGVIFDEY